MASFLKTILRVLLPLGVLYGSWIVYRDLVAHPPPIQQRTVPPTVTPVLATRLAPQSYQVKIETNGVVRPRTETTIIPEVSGTIVEVSPQFRDGGFFEKGDVLLRIDPLNYETAVTMSESRVTESQTALQEELARAGIAEENWKLLGKKGAPSDLALRKPQLAQAQSRLLSAEAELGRAKRDLERTVIRAPYAGRVLQQSVDLGQYVTPGTTLGKTFAVDYVEVRLPLTNPQLGFVDLPETFRGESPSSPDREGPEVLLSGNIGGSQSQWKGRIVRVEGALDQRSRQLFIVAQVDDPYRRTPTASTPLKIGLFVEAAVQGKELKNVFVVPRVAVRAGSEVIVIQPDNRIRRKKVTPLWSDTDHVILSAEKDGLKEGDVICLTPLAYPTNGARVVPTIDGVAPETETPGKKPGGTPPLEKSS